MKAFLIKVTLFALPLISTLLFLSIYLAYSGENFRTLNSFINPKEKLLVGYAYNEANYMVIKHQQVVESPRYDVLALGSSRVLQFRQEMFQSAFYNAGFTIKGISDFKSFIQSLPADKMPRMLIIGLDQWMFNANWDSLSLELSPTYWSEGFNFFPPSSTLISAMEDISSSKYDLCNEVDTSRSRIGLIAIENEQGFRNDGSMYYGGQISKLLSHSEEAMDFEYQDTYLRIKSGNRRFEYGEQVNPDAVSELANFLELCTENRIAVVAFIPPLSVEIDSVLVSSGQYQYMNDIEESIHPLFEKNETLELWNMSDLRDFGSGDDETIDGFHGGEVAYLRMLISMAERGSIIGTQINLSTLRNDLTNRLNRYIVYQY